MAKIVVRRMRKSMIAEGTAGQGHATIKSKLTKFHLHLKRHNMNMFSVLYLFLPSFRAQTCVQWHLPERHKPNRKLHEIVEAKTTQKKNKPGKRIFSRKGWKQTNKNIAALTLDCEKQTKSMPENTWKTKTTTKKETTFSW